MPVACSCATHIGHHATTTHMANVSVNAPTTGMSGLESGDVVFDVNCTYID
jgi:hypothetical protein